MKIVSFQSAVAYGHVGNSAALLPLQRLGHEVWPIDTVQFSNHPGHGGFRGMCQHPQALAGVIDGLAEVGALAEADGLLSGYLGAAGAAEVAARTIERIRVTTPGACYLCDPVMGDSPRGLYVDQALPALIRTRLLPLADIVTPNRFELECLGGAPVGDLAAARAVARTLLPSAPETGRPRLVVVTGLETDAADIAVMGVTDVSAWVVRTPRLALVPDPSGSGDLLAALLFGHLLGGRAIPEALSLAVSGLHAVLRRTLALGRREMALVAAQDEMIAPSRLFPADPFR